MAMVPEPMVVPRERLIGSFRLMSTPALEDQFRDGPGEKTKVRDGSRRGFIGELIPQFVDG